MASDQRTEATDAIADAQAAMDLRQVAANAMRERDRLRALLDRFVALPPRAIATLPGKVFDEAIAIAKAYREMKDER